MTVEELIKLLQEMPKRSKVLMPEKQGEDFYGFLPPRLTNIERQDGPAVIITHDWSQTIDRGY